MSKNSSTVQWQNPKELLRLQKLKLKKRALQKRMNGSLNLNDSEGTSTNKEAAFESIFQCKKRKNPFALDSNQPKRNKTENETLNEDLDDTLYKLLNSPAPNKPQAPVTSFSNVLTNLSSNIETPKNKEKLPGTSWCPLDWTLRKKVRLISLKSFPWSHKLKINEEATGITSFTRCLDIDQCDSSLDISSNAKFHQCCLYWQQPSLPWLSLFPRNSLKNNASGINIASNNVMKTSLFESWSDSLKSLYQLIRTRQCPYFYVCANSFTALFQAAGILGHSDLHVMVTPTTRGFRQLLKDEDIEYQMPLRQAQFEEKEDEVLETNGQSTSKPVNKEEEEEEDDDEPHEEWLSKLGVNTKDIKSIQHAQARIELKTECQVDNSDQSLILIEGVEVNGFFNFLLNCKSAVSLTGALAGVPPTLLAPVAFHGATLSALKVRETKMHSDGTDYYSFELTGPILPSTVHNILNVNNRDHSLTMTFSDVESTRGFSKVAPKRQRASDIERGTAIFGKENLSDCGLNSEVLKRFCSAEFGTVVNVECLKYSAETQSFTWT